MRSIPVEGSGESEVYVNFIPILSYEVEILLLKVACKNRLFDIIIINILIMYIIIEHAFEKDVNLI